jgi:predicted GIY-YIG superfamily endonuclease
LKIGFVMKRGANIGQMIDGSKPPKTKLDRKGVIYGIKCQDCELYYVGETGQHLRDRINQHQRDTRNKKTTNAMYVHFETKGHRIDWDNPVLIDREMGWKERKLKESVYISAQNPSEDIKRLMNLEKGTRLDPCWRVFGEEIREQMKEKVEMNAK